MDYQELRTEYRDNGLKRNELKDSPFDFLHDWMQIAIDEGISEANAMTLATTTTDGRPSARTLLLKQLDDKGLVFFTNTESRKGQELAENPKAVILFYWKELHRQVCIEGEVVQCSEEEVVAYFSLRPRESQIGAWASQQGKVIPDRNALEQKLVEAQQRFQGADVPRPPYWGGYRLIPDRFEFWQGQPHRLHDRFEYLRDGEEWIVQRLLP